jgi:hypothetical protein
MLLKNASILHLRLSHFEIARAAAGKAATTKPISTWPLRQMIAGYGYRE